MNSPSLLWNNPQDVKRLADLLKGGSVCIGTSDTVMGLMAPLSLQGFNALNQIKGRSRKPYLVLIGSVSDITKYAYLPKAPYLKELLKLYWPGPLTVVLKSKNDNMKCLQSENNTIAVRVPQHTGLLALLQHIDGIFSTSANKAGEPIPNTLDEVDSDILQSVACTIAEQDRNGEVLPSTIIDCSQDTMTLVREGAIPFEELKKTAEQLQKIVS